MQENSFNTFLRTSAAICLIVAFLSYEFDPSYSLDGRNANWFVAIFAGLVGGILITNTLQRQTISLTLQNKEQYVDRISVFLQGMRYNPTIKTESLIAFKYFIPDFVIPLGISIQIEGEKAIITGPKWHLQKIQEQSF